MPQKHERRQLTTDDLVNGIRTLLHQDDEDVARSEKNSREQKRSIGVRKVHLWYNTLNRYVV